MATWAEVEKLALALPETAEGTSRGLRQWQVKGKSFVWERPLLVAGDPDIYFTTSHFDGYAAVLVRFAEIGLDDLRELVVEAWVARAPKRLAKAYLDERLGG